MENQEQVESDFVLALRGGRHLKDAYDAEEDGAWETVVDINKKSAIVASCVSAAAGLILLAVIFYIFLFQGCGPAAADEIDLNKIMMIESSGNPLAWRKADDSRGLYQVTPICLKEFNNFHSKKYTKNDLWSPAINREIAEWYLTVRIPQMLKHYKIPDTVNNRLIAYNSGISCLVKNKPLPKITKRYIEKYQRGGVDFSYLGGIGTTLKRTTQQYVAQVQEKNRDQAQAAYEMIQQILRDLPDTARNRELMDEYYSLIEKIRATGKASLEIRKRLSELTSTQGAHIKTESVVRVNAY